MRNRATAAAGAAWTGRHVLLLILGFFGVVLAVNGTLVVFALSSWSGLSTENAYLKGLKYNDTIAAAREQNALGWTSQVLLTSNAEGKATIVLRFADATGRALSGLDVSARMMRPASSRFDQVPVLVPAHDGSYAGEVTPPLTGQWVVEVSAADRQGTRYTMAHRLVVRP